MVVVKHIKNHTPWITILAVGMVVNYWGWIDEALFPAVTIDHAKTLVVKTTRSITGPRPGDLIHIQGYGRNNRECEKEYRRVVEGPDHVTRFLDPGKGHRFIQGEEGWLQIDIQTQPDWPPGRYIFKSYGIFRCHPWAPAQIIPGITTEFTLH